MLQPFLDGSQRFTKAGFREASCKGSESYDAAEVLLKGPEVLLPNGCDFKDKQGHTRHEVRLRWWDQDATTLRRAALGVDEMDASWPDFPVSTEYQYADKIPVFLWSLLAARNAGHIRRPRRLSRLQRGQKRISCCLSLVR